MLTEITAENTVLMDDNPILREVSQPVGEFDATLALLADRMKRILADRYALGLAAIQIGVPLRMIVAKLDDGVTVMVNPTITRRLNRNATAREGCLSVLPRNWRNVDRPAKCEVTWQGLDGAQYSGGFSGLDARIIQHECDHLDGVLITDHPVSRA